MHQLFNHNQFFNSHSMTVPFVDSHTQHGCHHNLPSRTGKGIAHQATLDKITIDNAHSTALGWGHQGC
jgi:hypothetical protein